jgi:hypothetical protein
MKNTLCHGLQLFPLKENYGSLLFSFNAIGIWLVLLYLSIGSQTSELCDGLFTLYIKNEIIACLLHFDCKYQILYSSFLKLQCIHFPIEVMYIYK